MVPEKNDKEEGQAGKTGKEQKGPIYGEPTTQKKE
jgi:hypothetical protein